MKIATGIQNKVLEYFALGLPSVVSPSVALGLLPQSTGCFLSAQSADQWASAILALKNRTVDSEEIARHAFRYVRECHSWDAIGSEYSARLQLLMDGRVAKATHVYDVEPG
jgi:glycosyltransferase involved in cell wall biosynthesis